MKRFKQNIVDSMVESKKKTNFNTTDHDLEDAKPVRLSSIQVKKKKNGLCIPTPCGWCIICPPIPLPW